MIAPETKSLFVYELRVRAHIIATFDAVAYRVIFRISFGLHFFSSLAIGIAVAYR